MKLRLAGALLVTAALFATGAMAQEKKQLAFVVNGALVQARFPVTLPTFARPESREPTAVTRRSLRDSGYRTVGYGPAVSAAPIRAAIERIELRPLPGGPEVRRRAENYE